MSERVKNTEDILHNCGTCKGDSAKCLVETKENTYG